MTMRMIAGLCAVSLALSGCSSRPRAYAPQLASAPSDQRAFEQAYENCRTLYVAGKLDGSGRRGSAAGAAGAGAATAVVGGTTAAAVAGYSGLAVMASTVVLLPFAVVGGAVGMAKVKRAKKERAIQAAMTGCLAETGYEIGGWKRLTKAEVKEAKARAAAAPAAPAAPASAN